MALNLLHIIIIFIVIIGIYATYLLLLLFIDIFAIYLDKDLSNSTSLLCSHGLLFYEPLSPS